VNGCSKEETPSAPAMQPVQPLMADSGQVSNYVVLSRQQEDQRKLCHVDKSSPVSNVLPGPPIIGVELIEA